MKHAMIEVFYLGGEVKEYKNETLENVTAEVFLDDRDPETIVINRNTKLAWDPFIFNTFAAKGRIDEDTLISMTKIN